MTAIAESFWELSTFFTIFSIDLTIFEKVRMSVYYYLLYVGHSKSNETVFAKNA